jgi:hypothetical protein
VAVIDSTAFTGSGTFPVSDCSFASGSQEAPKSGTEKS